MEAAVTDRPQTQDTREEAGQDAPAVTAPDLSTIDMRARAVEAARLGFFVFRAVSTGKHKKPAFDGWQKEATSDPEQAYKLWTGATGEPEFYNIGIATGRLLPDGRRVLAVDLDTKASKKALAATEDERCAQFEKALGCDLPETVTARTTTNGVHLLYGYPATLLVPSPTGIIPGVDIRADRALIFGAGSYWQEREYVWEKGLSPADLQIATAPQRLLDFIGAGPAREQRPPVEVTAEFETERSIALAVEYLQTAEPDAARGNYHAPLMRVGQHLFDEGITPAKAIELILEHWEGAAGFESDELEYQIFTLAKSRKRDGKPWGSTAVENTFEPVEIAEGSDAPAATPAPKQRVYFAHEFAKAALSEKYDPLIDGLLDKNAFSLWVGDPKEGKTFVLLAIARAIAAGEALAGRRTARGLVCYFAGEGGKGILRRGLAVTQGRNDLAEMPFALIPARLDLVHGREGVDAIIRDVDYAAKKSGFDPEFITIDTVSRALAGGDENSPTDMGKFVSAIDRIRERTGAHVAAAHHLGKDKRAGARGHTLLRGAYDTGMLIGGKLIKNTDQRDFELTGEMPFRIKTVHVGPDADGQMLKTAIAEIAATSFAEPRTLKPAEQWAFERFEVAAERNPGGVVTTAAWNEAMIAAKVAEGDDAPARQTLSDWRRGVVGCGLVDRVGSNKWALA